MQLSGSGTLLMRASSRQAKSIPGQLSMFDLLTWPDSSSAISLPASVAGAELSGSPGSLTIDRSGPALVPANPSRSRGSRRDLPTIATSGQSGESLSPSDALQRSLESRLRQLLHGSDLCEVIWKPWATPWGRFLSRPVARARIPNGTDIISLPTPQAMDAKGFSMALKHKYRRTGHLKHWLHGTALAIHSQTGVSSWPEPMFAAWLLGYPASWMCARPCAPSAMPSTSGRRQHSSVPHSETALTSAKGIPE